MKFNPDEVSEQLRHYLGRWGQLRAFHEQLGIKPPRETLEDMMVRHGRPFLEREPLPKGAVRPESQECYWNAWTLWCERPGLRYCEGYVMLEDGILPVLHGWCIDENDRVLDPSVHQHKGAVYHGVVFNNAFTGPAWKRLRQHGLIGIFANAEVFEEDLFAEIEPASMPAAATGIRP